MDSAYDPESPAARELPELTESYVRHGYYLNDLGRPPLFQFSAAGRWHVVTAPRMVILAKKWLEKAELENEEVHRAVGREMEQRVEYWRQRINRARDAMKRMDWEMQQMKARCEHESRWRLETEVELDQRNADVERLLTDPEFYQTVKAKYQEAIRRGEKDQPLKFRDKAV